MSGAQPSRALAQLADDYWEGILRRNPTLATFFGDYRYNDRLPDIGPNGRKAEEADLRWCWGGSSREASLDTEDRSARVPRCRAEPRGGPAVHVASDHPRIEGRL